MKHFSRRLSVIRALILALLVTGHSDSRAATRNDDIADRINRVRKAINEKVQSNSSLSDVAGLTNNAQYSDRMNPWVNWGNWANWNNWNNWANWANWNNWANWRNF